MNQPTPSSPEPEIDLAKELAGPQAPKYTIRTMAQDLERARKEGVSPIAVAKAPPAPPAIKPITFPTSAPAPKAAISPAPTPMPIISKIPAPQAPMPPIIPPETLKMPPMPAPAAKAPLAPPSLPIKTGVMPPPLKKPSKISFSQLNLIIGIVAVIIILVGSIGFSYWWFFVRVAPIQPIEQPPIEEEKPEEKLPPAEPILPQGILITDQDIIIETSIKTASPEMLSSLLSQISASAKSLTDKKLARILIKYSSETEKQYLTFTESLALLQLITPETLNQNVTNGELLAYNQNGEIRYGFAAKITEGLKTLDAMNNWKSTILTDLKNIYIGTTAIKPEGATFKDNFYESFIKSFINLQNANTSLDWGVSDEKKLLLIATSKDMIYKTMNSVPVINAQ